MLDKQQNLIMCYERGRNRNFTLKIHNFHIITLQNHEPQSFLDEQLEPSNTLETPCNDLAILRISNKDV